MGGSAAKDVLELDECLSILIEAESCAVHFHLLLEAHDYSDKHTSFQHLLADLYTNLGIIERDRHATAQAAAFFRKSREFGDTDKERTHRLLGDLKDKGEAAHLDDFQLTMKLPGPDDFSYLNF